MPLVGFIEWKDVEKRVRKDLDLMKAIAEDFGEVFKQGSKEGLLSKIYKKAQKLMIEEGRMAMSLEEYLIMRIYASNHLKDWQKYEIFGHTLKEDKVKIACAKFLKNIGFKVCKGIDVAGAIPDLVAHKRGTSFFGSLVLTGGEVVDEVLAVDVCLDHKSFDGKLNLMSKVQKGADKAYLATTHYCLVGYMLEAMGGKMDRASLEDKFRKYGAGLMVYDDINKEEPVKIMFTVKSVSIDRDVYEDIVKKCMVSKPFPGRLRSMFAR